MSTKTAGTTQFQLGNLSLDLKLDGKAILNIEKHLGKSVMALFMNANGAMQMPPTNEILIVLQGANQKHGVSDTDMIKAFQEYLDQGNSPMDLFVAISNLFEESGFFGSKTPTDDKQETLTLDNEDVEETEADDKTL